jgi:hypothetical protein
MIDDAPTTTATELVHVPDHTMVIAGATPDEILSNAGQIANALGGLIESQGLSVSVGGANKHVEVGGWQAAGAMLGALGGTPLHAETEWSRRMDRDDAVVYEARVAVKTLAGETVGVAEAMCSSDERNWKRSDEFAIRSMAETRAESRAYRRAIGWVVKLAGYSPTPAEEMPVGAGGGGTAAPGGTGRPAWAAPITDITGIAQSLHALLALAGVDVSVRTAAVTRIGNQVLDDCADEFPLCVGKAIAHIVEALRSTEDITDDAPPVGDLSRDADIATADEEAIEVHPDQTTLDTTTEESA